MRNDNTKQERSQEITIKKVEAGKYKIPSTVSIKALVQGNNHVTLKHSLKRTLQHVKRLDAEHYVNILTGEVSEYKHHDTKHTKNMFRAFTQLKQAIRCNFDSTSSNQLFITLTYAENMTDNERLKKDWEKCYKRIQYALKGHDLAYIAVVEPQARGAWHLHIMLKSVNQSYLWIDYKDLNKYWGHGFTSIERLKSDDVGIYYTAYFTALLPSELQGELETLQQQQMLSRGSNGADTACMELASKMTKKKMKGARLSMYPVGMKFWRATQNIKKTVETEMSKRDVQRKGFVKSYERTYEMLSGDEVINVFTTIEYKRKQ